MQNINLPFKIFIGGSKFYVLVDCTERYYGQTYKWNFHTKRTWKCIFILHACVQVELLPHIYLENILLPNGWLTLLVGSVSVHARPLTRRMNQLMPATDSPLHASNCLSNSWHRSNETASLQFLRSVFISIRDYSAHPASGRMLDNFKWNIFNIWMRIYA